MDFDATCISYEQTGFFSKLVIDYLGNEEAIAPFSEHPVSLTGLASSIENRKVFKGNRDTLAEVLQEQYDTVTSTQQVLDNIHLLKKDTTFTVTTAHQPNIFTGPLYFLYKILHAIKLSAYCKEQFPQYDFVPVYYMGSEDADLDELGHIYLNGEKLEWKTQQHGAVGRMLVDKPLLQLVDKMAGEVGVLPYGNEVISIIKKYYTEGVNIQTATFGLVNELFGQYGLLVVIPDNPMLKSLAVSVFKDELLHGHSAGIVEETGKRLIAAGYKVQAHSREINLFYLRDGSRNRMVKDNDVWRVLDSDIRFSQEELLLELEAHPERFSPNVILRGLFQETILPNIVFIGGGGELAYWLQLKDLFAFYKVPYPVLILRNSFLLVRQEQLRQMGKLGFDETAFFAPLKDLQDKWILEHADNDISVDETLQRLTDIYQALENQSANVDKSLKNHVAALHSAADKRVRELGKKLMRAEKRHQSDAMRQIGQLKNGLFPHDNLQERIENFIPYYAIYGRDLITALYDNSLALDQDFAVLKEKL
ncbi:MAG: bacillithiol biosynthesis cysteine-adding enzyme BshC [Niabella sp.]